MNASFVILYQLKRKNKVYGLEIHLNSRYHTMKSVQCAVSKSTFSALDNDQTLFWLLNIEDKEILNNVGKFINEYML